MINKMVRGILTLVVLTVLLLLPTSVSAAKITIDGEDMGDWIFGNYVYWDNWENKGKVLQTVVIDATGGYFHNNGNEAGGDGYSVGVNINDLTMNGGEFLNRGKYYWTGAFWTSGTSQAGRIANVTVNSGSLHNNGIIDKARITNGTLLNTVEMVDGVTLEGGGHFLGWIGEATVEGGTLTNDTLIDKATVTGGTLENRNGGTINTATVTAGGTLENSGEGTITTANVISGYLNNAAAITTASVGIGTVDNSGTISSVTIGGGTLVNSGTITTATVDSGTLTNREKITTAYVQNSGILGNAGDIYSANVWGGILNNSTEITTANIEGGVLNNNGRVKEAFISRGTLNNTYDGLGSIDTVNVMGGILENDYKINTATITGGTLNNTKYTNRRPALPRSEGSISTVIINGGVLNNNGGSIGIANVNGGRLNVSARTANIEKVSLSSGIVDNSAWITTMDYLGGTYIAKGVVGNFEVSGEGGIGSIGTLNNHITIANVNVYNNGTLSNLHGATINNASQNGGTINNSGHIEELNYFAGTYKSETGSIGTLNIETDATGVNWGNLKTTNVNVNGRGLYENKNELGNTGVNNGGWLRNANQIDTATVNGGVLDNRGSITDATISRGNLNNWNGSTISGAEQTGGTISNGGAITGLTYFGGDYSDNYAGNSGTIGTLTLAGDSTGIEWGNVGEVVFADNGSGILTIKAFVSEEVGFRTASADLPANISFAGINAESINLDNGNVLFDLTGLGEYSDDFMGIFGEEGFAIPSIFGSTEVTGNLTEFAVSLDEEASSAADLIAFINAGMSDLGFSNAASENGLVWTFEAAPTTTPEPATLVILGLGLAGLGFARRRK